MSETKPSKRYLPDIKVEDYKKNPELVKSIVENALELYDHVVADNEELIAEKEELEHDYMIIVTENATLKEKVRNMATAINYHRFLGHFIGVFGGILITFGVGIIYSSQDHSSSLGWLLAIFGTVCVFAPAIYSRFLSKMFQGDELQEEDK